MYPSNEEQWITELIKTYLHENQHLLLVLSAPVSTSSLQTETLVDSSPSRILEVGSFQG